MTSITGEEEISRIKEKMMKVKKIYIAVSIALMTLTLASCRKEEPYVGPCSVNFRAYVQEERVVSRANDGYADIEDSHHPSFTAGLFVHASYEGNNYVTPSTLVWNGETLTTSLKLEQGSYTIYGYMPYNSGATFDKDDLVMTLPGLAGMSASNAMVIKPETVDIVNGKDKVTIDLEMDHLMARVTPYFYINDAEYAKLRTIKIKKVEFIHPNKAYTATVTYTDPYATDPSATDPSATDPSATHTTTWSEGAEMASAVTFYEETESPVVLEQHGKANAIAPSTCYFCPEMEISGLRMRVTYDVYDAKGNLTRPDAVAENSIKKISGMLSEATNYKLYIPLVPSYLYVLSDGDLDSEVLVVE